jgi:lipopolysaccharide export system permease protein
MALSHRKTWLYIGREFILSFAVAFLFFFFLFFINQILVMAEEIFSKKVPFWDVLRLIGYSLPVVIAFSFPFGSLVGALMAIGRLASDNELLAFGSLGIPPRQLLVPLIVLGILFSFVSFVMNDYFLPLGNVKYAQLFRRILYSNPSLELQPYSVKHYENTVIITGGVEGKEIKDILIIDKPNEGNRRLITAKSARLDESEDQSGVVSLTLDGVFSEISYPKEGDRYDYTLSRSMVYSILLKDISSASVGGLQPSTMRSADVWKRILVMRASQDKAVRQKEERMASLAAALRGGLRAAGTALAVDPRGAADRRMAVEGLWKDLNQESGKKVKDANLQSYLVELHRKFSMPAGCLVFAFFAFPVGIRARRSGRTVGFGVGLFVAIVYWGLLVAGQTFGVRMSLSPALSMWFPDALVFVVGAGFYLAGARR